MTHFCLFKSLGIDDISSISCPKWRHIDITLSHECLYPRPVLALAVTPARPVKGSQTILTFMKEKRARIFSCLAFSYLSFFLLSLLVFPCPAATHLSFVFSRPPNHGRGEGWLRRCRKLCLMCCWNLTMAAGVILRVG